MKKVEFSSIEEIQRFLYLHNNIFFTKCVDAESNIYLKIEAFRKLDGNDWKIAEVNFLVSDNDKGDLI